MLRYRRRGLKITLTHLPPGTSKWNRIEHRLFAFITMNWRGKPLVSHQVIVQLIGATTTDTGLKVCCEIVVFLGGPLAARHLRRRKPERTDDFGLPPEGDPVNFACAFLAIRDHGRSPKALMPE